MLIGLLVWLMLRWWKIGVMRGFFVFAMVARRGAARVAAATDAAAAFETAAQAASAADDDRQDDEDADDNGDNDGPPANLSSLVSDWSGACVIRRCST